MAHGNRRTTRSVVAQLNTDQCNRTRIARDLLLNGLPVHVALERFVRLQGEHSRAGQFNSCETLVELMENRAGKQQILQHTTLFCPGFEEDVLCRSSGISNKQMRERKDLPQRGINTCRLLNSQ